MPHSASRTEVPLEDLHAASDPYVGRWNRLVSSTNWEKGKIIQQWREDLTARRVPAAEYSDEVWSQRVGGVSPQHVGRLRRVCSRFGAVRDQYEGLFWSHFQTALDWEDAEMWLEGAVQNGWSVAQMRNQRCDTLGLVGPDQEGDATERELDEDVDASLDGGLAGRMAEVRDVGEDESSDADRDPFDESAPPADEGSSARELDEGHVPSAHSADSAEQHVPPFRPFESLAGLPEDFSEAVDQFKLAILRHKLSGWLDVSPHDVRAWLDALKELTLAP